MPASPAAVPSLARQKRAELGQLLDHLEVSIRKKLPPLIMVLSRGCQGEQANLVRKDIAAIKGLIKRVNPEVMKWGLTTDRLRYQNLMHSFDAQMRSAELRMQDKERRKFGRLDLDLPVRVEDGPESRSGRAVNLSLEGLKLRSGSAPRVGQTVLLDIEEGLPLRRVKGKVIWTRDSEAGGYVSGVKFLAMEEEVRELIRSYLNGEHDRQAACERESRRVKRGDEGGKAH